MKTKTLIIAFSLLILGNISAQNPFESIGQEAEFLTLTNGKYPEVFENDTLQIIGDVVFNTVTNKIEYFIERDTSYSEATLQPEIVSRWLSKDPLAAKYPSYSPYHFGYCNPIITIDPDGRENIVVIGNANNPKDPKSHPAGRQLLMTGLNEAIRLQANNTTNGEGTTILVFAGNYKDYELKAFIEKADAAGISYKIESSTWDIVDYINDKNFDRASDKITDFVYVGHSNSSSLMPSHYYDDDEFGENEDIYSSDLNSSAFEVGACLNLIGCNTAFGESNISKEMAQKIPESTVTGAPNSVMFGINSDGTITGAGTYSYQYADNSYGASPRIYRGNIQKVKPIQITSIPTNQHKKTIQTR
jgi:hypothetical protein